MSADALEIIVALVLVLLLLAHAMPPPRGLRPQDIKGYI